MQVGEGSVTASKTSGRAWLKSGETWPTCSNCQSPLRLVLQLNLQDLPGNLQNQFGTGLLQLFCCESNFQIHTGNFTTTPAGSSIESIELSAYENEAGELMMESSWLLEQTAKPVLQEFITSCCLWACEPFSSSQLARVVQPQGASAEMPVPALKPFFPPKLIVGWEATSDYPLPEEVEGFGITLNQQEAAALDEAGLWAKADDKLGGWPCWAQSVHYPHCPLCDQAMSQLLFQLEQAGSDHFPYPHRGLGVGYLVQCPTHLDQVTFFCQFT